MLTRRKFNSLLENFKQKEGKLAPIKTDLTENIDHLKNRKKDSKIKSEVKMIELETTRLCSEEQVMKEKKKEEKLSLMNNKR